MTLEPIDLTLGEKGEHPDFNDKDHFLVRKEDRYYFGTFNRQWYGWNFYCNWGASGGFQYDKPGTNSSTWERVWRLILDDEEIDARELARLAAEEKRKAYDARIEKERGEDRNYY